MGDRYLEDRGEQFGARVNAVVLVDSDGMVVNGALAPIKLLRDLPFGQPSQQLGEDSMLRFGQGERTPFTVVRFPQWRFVFGFALFALRRIPGQYCENHLSQAQLLSRNHRCGLADSFLVKPGAVRALKVGDSREALRN